MSIPDYNNLKFEYDSGGDVLYAFFVAPKPCLSVEVRDGVLIERDMESFELAGFTIIDYRRRKRDGLIKNIPFFPDVPLPEV